MSGELMPYVTGEVKPRGLESETFKVIAADISSSHPVGRVAA